MLFQVLLVPWSRKKLSRIAAWNLFKFSTVVCIASLFLGRDSGLCPHVRSIGKEWEVTDMYAFRSTAWIVLLGTTSKFAYSSIQSKMSSRLSLTCLLKPMQTFPCKRAGGAKSAGSAPVTAGNPRSLPAAVSSTVIFWRSSPIAPLSPTHTKPRQEAGSAPEQSLSPSVNRHQG